jgi:hypothetical protein
LNVEPDGVLASPADDEGRRLSMNRATQVGEVLADALHRGFQGCAAQLVSPFMLFKLPHDLDHDTPPFSLSGAAARAERDAGALAASRAS